MKGHFPDALHASRNVDTLQSRAVGESPVADLCDFSRDDNFPAGAVISNQNSVLYLKIRHMLVPFNSRSVFRGSFRAPVADWSGWQRPYISFPFFIPPFCSVIYSKFANVFRKSSTLSGRDFSADLSNPHKYCDLAIISKQTQSIGNNVYFPMYSTLCQQKDTLHLKRVHFLCYISGSFFLRNLLSSCYLCNCQLNRSPASHHLFIIFWLSSRVEAVK